MPSYNKLLNDLVLAQMLESPISNEDKIALQDTLWSLSDGSYVKRADFDAFVTAMKSHHAHLLINTSETVDTNETYTELVAIHLSADEDPSADSAMYIHLVLSDQPKQTYECCWRFSTLSELRNYLEHVR